MGTTLAGLPACAALTAAQAVATRNKLLNLATRQDRTARIDARAQDMLGQHGDQALYYAIVNELHSLNSGDRLSAEAMARTRAAQYATLANELDRAGVLQAARNGTVARDWGRELFELSSQAAGNPTATPGITGNAVAKRIADIIHNYQTLAKNRLNSLGSWIGSYDGWITSTSHDADAMLKAGYENWRDFIEPRLDPKTFAGVTDRDKFLHGTYAGLVSGEHTTDASNVGFKDPAFVGPGNLAKKLSAERILHFRGASAWMDYQHEFGNGSLLEQVVHNLDRSARQEALLKTFGTNPQAELQRDVQFFSGKYHDTNPTAVRYLKDHAAALDSRLALLDGRAGIPVNRLFSKIGSYTRLWETLSKLGAVVLTHLSALSTKPTILRSVGMNLGEQYGNFFRSILTALPAERRTLADLHLASMEGMHRDLLGAYSLDDSLPGTASKISNSYFKINGLTGLLNAQKSGAMWAGARFLGGLADKAFQDLPEQTQEWLRQFRINAADWDTLRTASHAVLNRRAFVTPKDAGADEDLSLRLHSLLVDLADRSVITPGIRARALITAGTRPGTLPGELARWAAQFKLWSIQANLDIGGLLKREIQMHPMRGIAGTMQTIGTMAVVGTMILQLKQLVAGKNIAPLDDPRTWMRGLAQSGGLGIAGDFLAGQYNRFGGGLGDTLLGPVAGEMGTAISNWWGDAKDWAAGAPGHPGKRLAAGVVSEALNNIPFSNLFYARSVFDFLLGDSLKESINPGYLRRRERYIQRQSGETYYLAPSEYHMQTFGR